MTDNLERGAPESFADAVLSCEVGV